MIASSGLVLSNLAYLIGAVVVAFAGGIIVWIRHRRPKSVAANVAYFHRGLQALAPDERSSGSGGRVVVPEARQELRSVAIVRPQQTGDAARAGRGATPAGEAGEEQSGAETG